METSCVGVTISLNDEKLFISVNNAVMCLSSPPSVSFPGSFTISFTTSFDRYVENACRRKPFSFSLDANLMRISATYSVIIKRDGATNGIYQPLVTISRMRILMVPVVHSPPARFCTASDRLPVKSMTNNAAVNARSIPHNHDNGVMKSLCRMVFITFACVPTFE